MKSGITFLLTFLFLNTNFAQYDNCNRWSIGMNFTSTIPIDEMSSNNFRANYGMTINGLYNLTPQSQLMSYHIGGRLTGGLGIGERDNITLEDPAGAAARSSVYNTLVDLHLLGRVVFHSNKNFQPYFDFFGGGRLLGANHDIKLKERNFNYDRRTSDRITQSANWAWGTGSGVYININQNAYLDIGINYTYSGTQEFVDLNTVKAVDDIVEWETAYSVSNSIGLHVGFHVTIDCDEDYEEEYHNDPYRGEGVRFKRNRKTPRAKTRRSSSGKN